MLMELFRSADILSLVIDNYVLFIMVIGTFLVTGFDKLLDKRIVRLSRLALTLLLLLVLGENVKAWNDVAPRNWFLLCLLSALCYSVRISIMLVLVWIIQKKVSKWVVLPAVFNAIVAFSVFFTDIAYSYDDNLDFARGPLGFTPYIVSVFYLVYLLFISLKILAERSFSEGVIVLFIALSSCGAGVCAFFAHDEVTNPTFAAGILLYYLYVYQQLTKHDAQIKDEQVEQLGEKSERAIAASEAKSAFLSNMSHEIRTPINAVLGMNEMILRESDDENVLAYSESIRTAGNTLLGIVNDILDFSKIEAGKMEIIPVDYDLSSVINDLVHMVQTRADDKGLVLKLDFDRDTPKLLNGDEVRIKQVVTNILTNAVKYTEKGSVTFSLGFERVPGDDDGVYLLVSVKDTGIGIKPEDMKKLFSEFERIEEKRNRTIEGTGLGMNITKRLLEMMGSSLHVESIYDEGSTFSFRLEQRVVEWKPLGDYEESYRASLAQRKKTTAKFSAPDALVLVVDDTPMNLMVFKSLLKRTGVQIDTAASGDEGLALAYDKKYDIIFLDHMMPEKDGIETLHELRAREKDQNRETPTICLTANAISGAREKYLAAGFDDYLTKPIDSARLEEMLMQYLPREKLRAAAEKENTVDEETTVSVNVDGIDTATGMANCGGAETFQKALELFYQSVGAKSDEIEGYWHDGDIKNYTVKVHALKSSARMIGALKLSEQAKALEDAGNANDTAMIDEKTPALLELYRSYAAKLQSLFDSGEDDRAPIDEKTLSEAYASLAECAGIMDYDTAEMVLDSLKDYRLPPEDAKRMEDIHSALVELDWERLAALGKH